MTRTSIIVATILVAGAAASADLMDGFSANIYTVGSPANGTNGWYRPAVAGSIDGLVQRNGANPQGVAANPKGGKLVLIGRSEGGTSFARNQRNHDFGAQDQWELSWDFACAYDGTTPSAINLGSFSPNHETLGAGTFRGFIALNNFTDVNNPSAGWKAEMNVFDGVGTALNNQSPGAAFTNLAYNHWYRQFVGVDFGTNQVLYVGIQDLTSGVKTVVSPSGWYMNGGTSTALPRAGAIRTFAGGSLGNITAWDRVRVGSIPTPGALGVLALGGLVAARRRRA